MTKNRITYPLGIIAILIISTLTISSSYANVPAKNLLDARNTMEIEISPLVSQGIVPYNAKFGVTYYNPGYATLRNIYWDFDNDGIYEHSGLTANYQQTEAITENIYFKTLIEAYDGRTGRTTNFTRHYSYPVEGYAGLMSITFDDGHITGHQHALPLFEDKEITGTSYIVTSWVGWNINYMDWSEINDLQNSGWDIGSHGVGSTNFTECMQRGIPIGPQCNQLIIHPNLALLNNTQIDYELSESQRILREGGFSANHFAYPHGGWSSLSYNLSKDYYNSARITNDSYNDLPENLDIHTLQVKGGNDRTKNLTIYQEYIDDIILNRSWLIFNQHIILDTCNDMDLCVSTDNLGLVIDYAKANRVKIVNIEEAITGSWKN